jgi:tetratricopeptide (TPR) repeat protein
MLSMILTAAGAGPPASGTADDRPRVAVIRVEMAPGADPRDAWMSVAIDETLTWRLRRVQGLITTPTARLTQARREFAEESAAAAGPTAPSTERVAEMLGARRFISGVCTTTVGRGVSLELELSSAIGSAEPPARTVIAAAGIFDALDQATRWLLDQLVVAGSLDAAVRELIFAPPCRSPTALEYYAKAVIAARAEKMSDVAHYVEQSLGYDAAFREALHMRSRLALNVGRAGEMEAARGMIALGELARRANDSLDRFNAELGEGIVAAMSRNVDGALDRFESAMTIGHERRDPYEQIAAAGHLTDLYLAQRPPGDVQDEERRKRLARELLARAADWQAVHLDLVRGLVDVLAEGPSATKLALIREELEQWPEALALHKQALAAAERTGLQRPAAGAWMLLAQHHSRRRQWGEALEAAGRCLALSREQDAPAARVMLAEVHEAMGTPSEALGQYELAYAQIRDSDKLRDQLLCLRRMAELRMKLGRKREAMAAQRDAIDIAHALALPDEEELRRTLEAWQAAGP